MIKQSLSMGYLAILSTAAIILGIIGVVNITSAKVVVEWSSASELETAGYNIYRSQTSGGTLTKVNDHLISPSSDPLIGGDYTYTDHDVKPGLVYYYYLEDLSTAGAAIKHGPIEIKANRGGVLELMASVVSLTITIVTYITMRRYNDRLDNQPLGDIHAA